MKAAVLGSVKTERKLFLNTRKKDMEKIMEMLNALATNGEAKLELTMRIVREDSAVAQKPARPYDKELRLSGYRGIAGFLGTSVNYAVKLCRDGSLRTYNIGRKVYAYQDEILESMKALDRKKAPVRSFLERREAVV